MDLCDKIQLLKASIHSWLSAGLLAFGYGVLILLYVYFGDLPNSVRIGGCVISLVFFTLTEVSWCIIMIRVRQMNKLHKGE